MQNEQAFTCGVCGKTHYEEKLARQVCTDCANLPTVLVMSVKDNRILHLTTVLAKVKIILSGNWEDMDTKKAIAEALAVLYTEAGIETFEELFAKFDAWHWDKFRHHPEKMLCECFYKFLNQEAV